MKVLTLAAIFLVFASLAHAQSCRKEKCVQGFGCQLETVGTLTLEKRTILCFGSLEIRPGTVITTASYPLTLRVEDSLVVGEGVTIRACNSGEKPPAPPTPPAGDRAVSYNRGPETEGRDPARNGGDGQDGLAGREGTAGATPSDIVVQIGGRLEGQLQIDASGCNGGDGGPGSNGGAGADGEQGPRAQTAWGPFNVATGCASGGGYGANGGAGGAGGVGGIGGSGGAGGRIIIQLRDLADQAKIVTSFEGGVRGQRGRDGQPGALGQAGFGGRGATGCQGEETNRMGKPGGVRTIGQPPPENPMRNHRGVASIGPLPPGFDE